MTGRRYYLTTTRAWQRLAHRCTEAHFIVLGIPDEKGMDLGVESRNGATSSPAEAPALILALVTADEAAHIALETDTEFKALPHPLSRTPISERVAAALAPWRNCRRRYVHCCGKTVVRESAPPPLRFLMIWLSRKMQILRFPGICPCVLTTSH